MPAETLCRGRLSAWGDRVPGDTSQGREPSLLQTCSIEQTFVVAHALYNFAHMPMAVISQALGLWLFGLQVLGLPGTQSPGHSVSGHLVATLLHADTEIVKTTYTALSSKKNFSGSNA